MSGTIELSGPGGRQVLSEDEAERLLATGDYAIVDADEGEVDDGALEADELGLLSEGEPGELDED